MKSGRSERGLGVFEFNDSEKCVVIDGEFRWVKGVENLEIGLCGGGGDSECEGDEGG